MASLVERVKEVGGRVKKRVGELLGDEELEAEGTVDEAEAKVRGAAARVVDDVKDTVEDVKKRAKKGARSKGAVVDAARRKAAGGRKARRPTR